MKDHSAAGAIELTKMKLSPGSTLQGFLDANQEIDVWIRQRPGFRGRHIAQDDDGVVLDLVFWDGRADGEAACSALLAHFASSPIHDVIAQRTVFWTVAPIVSTTTKPRP